MPTSTLEPPSSIDQERRAAKPPRLVFLDLMRFLALFMMIQGHTIYAMLDRSIRDGDSTGIRIWTFFRGYTAPFFMVISGCIFTYLLMRENRDGSRRSARFRKGFLRVLSLLGWGYALRFPIRGLWQPVSQRLWDVALAVDVLHVIAAGLAGVMAVFWLLKHHTRYLMFGYAVLAFGAIFASPWISQQSVHRERTMPIQFEPLDSSSEEGTGLGVSGLAPQSDLARAGVRPGDRLLRYHDAVLRQPADLARARAALPSGATTSVVLARGTPPDRSITLTLQQKSEVWWFPDLLSFWLNEQASSSGISSSFPLFPWLAYLLFGGAFGAWLWTISLRQPPAVVLATYLFAFAIALFAVAGLIEQFVVDQWQHAQHWGQANPGLILHRLGGVMLVGAIAAWLAPKVRQLPPLMNRMTQNTLWLYVGHLVILYTIRPMIFRQHLGVAGTLACVVGMFMLMILQTKIIEKKQAAGSWRKLAAELGH